jgi:hypothetical protein
MISIARSCVSNDADHGRSDCRYPGYAVSNLLPIKLQYEKNDELNMPFVRRYDTPHPVADNPKKLIREMNIIHDVEPARSAAPG